MRIFSEKYRLLGWVSAILVVGFLATSIAGYVVSRDSVRRSISEQALPLTGDNIYAAIQKDLLQPVLISSLMAHDTFVRDWMLGGEENTEQIVRYLQEIKKRYGTVTSFLVSERSHRYYYAGGTRKPIDANDPRDKWYFRVRDMTEPYETNIDPDMGNLDTMTIFINHRVLDYRGNFIGVAGVGLTFDTMALLIDSYQTQFHRGIYFVDAQGTIVLAGRSMKHMRGSLRELLGVRDIASSMLNGSSMPTRLDYRLDRATILVNSRFIPELGWYMIVEQNMTGDVEQVQQVFIVNLAISAIVTLLVLAITLYAVNYYQRRLERVATTDGLTGLLNRQAFDIVLQQAIREVARSGRPLCAILFDIDFFKRINDTHGHLAGDHVISNIAKLARTTVREADTVARWGGEEFLILLRDCPVEKAFSVAEKLRCTIEAHDFGLAQTITVSLGVTQYAAQESQAAFFARADAALYAAKEGGRNRSALLPVGAQEKAIVAGR